MARTLKKTTLEKKATQNEVKKIAVKKEPKKLTTKEPLKQVSSKKIEKIATAPELKKVTTKEVKKITTKKVQKKETKPRKADEKKAYYDAMSIEDCILNMQKMNVQYQYEDYVQLLFDESDRKQIIENIKVGNHLHDLSLDYKIDGYDIDLVKVTLDKVGKTVDITAADFKNLKMEIETCTSFTFNEDNEKNAEEYLKEFHLCERIMMLGRRKHIQTLEEMDALLKTDISSFTKHFMDFAYQVLTEWKFEDIVFYEEFMYAYLSCFDELYFLHEQRIQLDCADLYILHGDRERGNNGYDYLLRDNQIKDYIYYRFAHIYEDIDLDMAKAIAESALQFVDNRYVYYPHIMEIIQK